MSEDIEAKIRRLRELGKASVEPETPAPAKPVPPKKSPRRTRSIGSLRAKERKRRILIGASVIVVVILLISIGAYTYLQNRSAEEFSKLKSKKLAEVNVYFKPENFNNTNCSQEANAIKAQLLSRIANAKSIEDLESIDVKASYDLAVKKYNACLEEIRRQEFEKALKKTKDEKIKDIEIEFQPLLSMPLPDDIKTRVISAMKELEDRVNSARTFDEVNSVNPDPYLLELWRSYYFWRIDYLASQGYGDVILEYEGSKKMFSISDAKAILGGINDYRELMKYRVAKVEWVELSLVIPKKNVNGAFLAPNDRIKIFIQGQNTTFDGYFELVLLPVSGGSISVSESQSQSGSSSSSSSSTYSESHSSSANPGGASISDSSSASDSYSNSQSTSQSSSASYSYSVNLGEILKAIAAGKIKASEDVKQELSSYGWKVLNLEKETALESIDHNTPLLVIIRVPSIFVPDILQNQNNLYITRVST